jgi:hypothetical protein
LNGKRGSSAEGSNPKPRVDDKAVISESEEGYGIACPDLSGSWPHGAAEEKALENIARYDPRISGTD